MNNGSNIFVSAGKNSIHDGIEHAPGGGKALLDPTDTMFLLLDHQSGLFQNVKDISVAELRANTTALAKLAALCQILMPAPFEAYSIGGLVVLVPGLALTTAIAELADQNLVSGTAKLMQAVLTLLALGLAYMLFQNQILLFLVHLIISLNDHPMCLLPSYSQIVFN